jgi:hypothetical protein
MSEGLPFPAPQPGAGVAVVPENQPPEETPPQRVHWGWILAIWTFVGTLRATQRFLRSGELQPDMAYSWWAALGNNLFLAYLWAALTPAVMKIARRFAPGRVPLAKLVPVHLAAAVAVALLHTVLSQLIYKLLLAPEVSWTELARNFASSALTTGPTRISTYLEIVGITWGLDYYRMYREREIQASNLQAQLADARLEALKLQLRPTFVFNALNTILPLIYRNAQAAARTVVQLGDLLRLSLKSGATQLVALDDELHFLELYLQIEKTRLADRLSVTFEIEREAASAAVPNLILHPLVENAVARAGVSPGGVRIRITGRRLWDSVRVEVSDETTEAPQDPAMRAMQESNLAKTRRRLEHLFPGRYACEVLPLAGGQQVALTMPYAFAPIADRVPRRTGSRRTGGLAPPATGGAQP